MDATRRSVFLFCIYGRDPVVHSKCSIVILAGNVLIPCLLTSQQRLTLPSRQTVQKDQQWLHLFKLFSSEIYLDASVTLRGTISPGIEHVFSRQDTVVQRS